MILYFYTTIFDEWIVQNCYDKIPYDSIQGKTCPSWKGNACNKVISMYKFQNFISIFSVTVLITKAWTEITVNYSVLFWLDAVLIYTGLF